MFHRHNSLTLTHFFLLLSVVFSVQTTLGNTLLEVRVGPHKNFDRIVFEFESEATSRVEIKSDQTVEIHFDEVRVSPTFSLPPLPPGLTMMKSIKAFKEGDHGLVFEIPLSKDAAPSKLALPGRPWRLALDLASKVTIKGSPPVPESKPEYIPGDIPIPTKMAEEDKEKAPEYIPGDLPIPTKLAEENKEKAPEYIPGDLPIPTKMAEAMVPSDDSFESAKAHAILAYFYTSSGEPEKAEHEAKLYQKITGKELNLVPETGPQTQPQSTSWLKSFDISSLSGNGLTLIVLAGIAFAAGLLGGFIATRRLPKISLQRTPKSEKKQKQKAAAARDKAEELEDDLDLLHKAIEQEPKSSSLMDYPDESTLIPEEVVVENQEEEVKESVMDRRVRRVLELSKQGRDIQSIAQELEMGQDEVKLILDLNQ